MGFLIPNIHKKGKLKNLQSAWSNLKSNHNLPYVFNPFHHISSVIGYNEVNFRPYFELVTNFFWTLNDSFCCVRVSKFLFRFWSNNVNFNVAGFYDKTKETGKHKQKKERVKGKFKERRRERKGQGRVKDTKEKRKHWKSKSEVGKENLISLHQCLGSGSGSVWSARFWLPGSGTAKICRSTEPIPRGKISTKNCKKNFLPLKPKSELVIYHGHGTWIDTKYLSTYLNSLQPILKFIF